MRFQQLLLKPSKRMVDFILEVIELKNPLNNIKKSVLSIIPAGGKFAEV